MFLVHRLLRPFTASAITTPIGSGMSLPPNTEKATLAAGCFWGVEHLFRRHFAAHGLLDARVGYIGGTTTTPSYREVCSGRTQHAEAVQLLYDPAQLSYAALLEFFFRMHDPTTPGRQGGDIGSQYRSAIFTHGEEQRRVAEEVRGKVQAQWWGKEGGKVVTEIVPAGKWWDAEEYHQLYLERNPGGYECPAHFVRQFPPLS